MHGIKLTTHRQNDEINDPIFTWAQHRITSN
jgi:hypothetical protein